MQIQFDLKVPTDLMRTQQWFASIITRPIDEDNKMNPVSPTGKLMKEEACSYIAPSPTMQPANRIELYNQQYWWRLLSTLQENFPTLARMFGTFQFNQQIGFPFLVAYPPDHWSLTFLGKELPEWLRHNYQDEDKHFVWLAATVDLAYTACFLSKQLPTIDLTSPDHMDQITETTLYLQPNLHFFQMPFDLFDFRKEFISQKDPDYFVDHDFPNLNHFDEMRYFILFRTLNNNIAVENVSSAEYQLLQKFADGYTIDAVCEWLEKEGASIAAEAAENLHLWFQRWTACQLLTHVKPS